MLSIGVLDREREHQCATTTVLSHLTSRVRVALHKGNDTGRGQCTIQHGAACGTQVRKVVTYATATLHQLYLLLVDADNTAIRVSGVLVTDHEAVRQRCNLQCVADTGHRAALRNHVAEVVEQLEHLVCRHRVSVAVFDTGDLVSDTPMHLFGRSLIDVTERVFQSILAHPHRSGQFVTCEVLFRGRNCLSVRILLQLGCFLFFGHSILLFYCNYQITKHVTQPYGDYVLTKLRIIFKNYFSTSAYLFTSYQQFAENPYRVTPTVTRSILPPSGGASFDTSTRTRSTCGHFSRIASPMRSATFSRMSDVMRICSPTSS